MAAFWFRVCSAMALAGLFATPGTAETALAPPQAASTPLACPARYDTLRTKSPDAYVVVLTASQRVVADLHINAYTAKSVYAIDVPAEAFSTEMPFDFLPYRGAPIVMAPIPNDPYLGVTIQSTVGTTRCPMVASVLSGDYRRTNSSLAPNPIERDYQAKLDAEIANAIPRQATLETKPALPCAKPWIDATTDRKAEPNYPEMAAERGEGGVGAVKLFLDEAGNVTRAGLYASTGSSLLDKATMDAAVRTTYKPEIAACVPVEGAYLYIVEFSR